MQNLQSCKREFEVNFPLSYYSIAHVQPAPNAREEWKSPSASFSGFVPVKQRRWRGERNH